MLASSHKCTCRDSKRKFRKFQILQIIEFVKSIKRDHCNKIKLKIKNERDWLKKKKKSLYLFIFGLSGHNLSYGHNETKHSYN